MSPISNSSLHPQHIIRLVLVVILAGLVLAYVHFQARFFIQGPQVELTGDLPTVQHERTIALAGTTANITELLLNGKAVFIDEKGHFERTLVLESGYTIMTLTAKDRYGRTKTVTKEFVLKL